MTIALGDSNKQYGFLYNAPMKQDLRGLTLAELERSLLDLSERSFRARQVFGWVQQKGVATFDQMVNLPQALRAKLVESCQISSLVKRRSIGDTSTHKYLWQLPDGLTVESVLLDDDGRRTICLSSQVGCKMDCSFCASAKIKFRRHLTAGEIISQVLQIEQENGPVSNLVFMGMGEPLDNYDNVLKSIKILNDPAGRNIGLRKITISTCGLVPAIERLAAEQLPIKLAVSLNTATDKIRGELMPVNKKYPLAKLIPAIKKYSDSSGRRSTIEYVLIKGLNDSRQSAQQLIVLLEGLMVNVNLIAFNPFKGCAGRAPLPQEIKQFRQLLEKAGFEVTQRFIRGQSFGAACGQLTGGYFE